MSLVSDRGGLLKNFKRLLAVSVSVALASQVYLSLSDSDFVFSAGVVILAIFIYYNKDLSPIWIGILSGFMVYLTRLSVYTAVNGYNSQVLISFMPDMLFYIVYPVFNVLLIKDRKKDYSAFVFIALVFCDLSANTIELLFRHFVLSEPNLLELIPSLFIVGIVRSLLACITIIIFNNYDMMITKREHEDRYKRLLWLTSQLKTEAYWLEKNMDNIEKVMKQSYDLFEQITTDKNKGSWAKSALNIARDVHEIKKENGLAVRGIKGKVLDGNICWEYEYQNIKERRKKKPSLKKAFGTTIIS
jgi:two-component system sensor histidine kinase YcbA